MAEVEALLAKIPLFEKLDEGELEKLEEMVTTDGKLAGSLIFSRGDAPDAFYVVARGLVEIVLDEDTKVPLGEGEFFGEMGVMNSAPRNADAIAAEDSVLLRISKDAFDRVLTMDESIAAKVMSACLERGKDFEVTADGAAEEVGALLAFYSPRGGAGTTSLAVNVACRLADLSKSRVGLVDADLQFGNVHMLLDAKGAALGIADHASKGSDATLDEASLVELIEPLECGVDLVRTPKKTEEADLVSPFHLADLLTNMRERCGTVVVDLPSVLNEKTLSVLERASLIILVVEPELVSVARALDCMRLFELAGLDVSKVRPVVNKLAKGGLPVEGIEKMLKRPLYGTVVRDTRRVADAIHEGQPVVKRDKGERISIEMTNLARRILNPFDPLLQKNEEAKKKQGFSLWGFLMGPDEEPGPGSRA